MCGTLSGVAILTKVRTLVDDGRQSSLFFAEKQKKKAWEKAVAQQVVDAREACSEQASRCKRRFVG